MNAWKLKFIADVNIEKEILIRVKGQDTKLKTSLVGRLIDRHPDKLVGHFVVVSKDKSGTRLTVELILEKLAYGETYEGLVASYPILKEENIRAAVLYASRAVSAEEIVAA